MYDLLPLLHFNPVAFGLTFAVFAVLLIILSKVAWGPILKALDERDQSIRGDLDLAEQARAQAEKLEAQHKQALSELREEARKIREEARDLAAKEREELLKAARAESSQLVEAARQDIGREREQALEDIKGMAVEVGVALARKLLAREIDRDKHDELVRESMSDIERALRKAG